MSDVVRRQKIGLLRPENVRAAASLPLIPDGRLSRRHPGDVCGQSFPVFQAAADRKDSANLNRRIFRHGDAHRRRHKAAVCRLEAHQICPCGKTGQAALRQQVFRDLDPGTVF